jgi:hypothetical protein
MSSTDFKIQSLCSTDDLRKIAYLSDVPRIDSLSKDELCTILQERIQNELLDIRCENNDEPTMSGSSLSEIPDYLKITVKGVNGKNYCYNVIDLYKEIQYNNKKDHFNRIDLDTVKDKVISRYTELREILSENVLSEFFDEPVVVSSPQNKSDKQILIDFWSRMYYPGLTIEEYLGLSDKEYARFLVALKNKGIRATAEEALDKVLLIKNSNEQFVGDTEGNIVQFDFATRAFAQKYRERQDQLINKQLDLWFSKRPEGVFYYFQKDDIRLLSINGLIKLRDDLGIDKKIFTAVEILEEITKLDATEHVIEKLNQFFIAKFNIRDYLVELDDWGMKHYDITVDEMIEQCNTPYDIYYQFVEDHITCEDTMIELSEMETEEDGVFVTLIKEILRIPEDCLDNYESTKEQIDKYDK